MHAYIDARPGGIVFTAGPHDGVIREVSGVDAFCVAGLEAGYACGVGSALPGIEAGETPGCAAAGRGGDEVGGERGVGEEGPVESGNAGCGGGVAEAPLGEGGEDVEEDGADEAEGMGKEGLVDGEAVGNARAAVVAEEENGLFAGGRGEDFGEGVDDDEADGAFIVGGGLGEWRGEAVAGDLGREKGGLETGGRDGREGDVHQR